jgi:hypothetical protein
MVGNRVVRASSSRLEFVAFNVPVFIHDCTPADSGERKANPSTSKIFLLRSWRRFPSRAGVPA